jgi:tetratricopeptide (TPR) repeat protein
MHRRSTRWLTALLLCLAVTGTALAAGGEAETPKDPFSKARELMAARQWPAALADLKQINAVGNADWHNLMGYGLRKSSPPDLEGAQQHYDEALRLKPNHRGALEYSGELYLMKGDLASAEKRLAQLDKACFFGCEEYKDLKKAIEQYKANGNKIVAQ